MGENLTVRKKKKKQISFKERQRRLEQSGKIEYKYTPEGIVKATRLKNGGYKIEKA